VLALVLWLRGRGHGGREKDEDKDPEAPPPGLVFPRPPAAVVPFSADQARELQKQCAAQLKQPMMLTSTVGMELSLIPPGAFARTADSGAQLTRPFYMGRHEVTIGQFRKFVEETGYRTEAERSPAGGIVKRADGTRVQKPEFTWRHKDVAQGDDYPVGQLAWNDAVRFCDWLSRKEGRVYRLPTEAEWEWACRAGSATPQFFGDGKLEDYGWVRSNSGWRSHPVGQLRPNAWGLFDLYGNHAEFCSDWSDDYPPGIAVDPTGPEEGEHRVIRGGGFVDALTSSAERYGAAPDFSMWHFGFRVVCEVPAEAPRFATLIDANVKQYENWLARLRADGFRPVSLQVRDAGGEPRFQAVALQDGLSVPWEAPVGVDFDDEQKRFEELVGQSYRPLVRCGYLDGAAVRFASLWTRGGPDSWYSYHGLSGDDLGVKGTEMTKLGFRPESLQGYFNGEQTVFTACFVPGAGVAVEVLSGVPPARLGMGLARRKADGYRPISLGAYATAQGPRFPVIWLADQPGLAWELRLGLTAEQYRQEEDAWASRGYRPQTIVGYDRQGKTEYAAVWVRDRFAEAPLPRSGPFVPELEPFDRAMTQFMRQRDIPAGALAVVRDGKVVLSRGYGWADRERTKPLPEDAPFRLASVTKMITAAAVRKLIRDGKVRRDTKVYDLLGLEPPPGQALDPRWKAVTVGHLLDHQGGWDVDKAGFDPMFHSIEISAALGKPGPASAADVIRYMAGQPLQFDPGAKTVYSNFGYCLLGRVIEKVSGRSYIDYLRTAVLESAAAKGVALGRTLPADRDPREPFYSDPNRVRNVMRPESKDKVPEPDGGFCLEALDSHGGLTASAADVARFLTAFALDGGPAADPPAAGAIFGSLPGTHTMALQRADGVRIVVLFNQRTDPSGLDYFKIEEVMNRAAQLIKR
jgi:formylglycine-generating enzyme required for sulfatase activity/CubicO group peptidase (beta-lactamase class C family)